MSGRHSFSIMDATATHGVRIDGYLAVVNEDYQNGGYIELKEVEVSQPSGYSAAVGAGLLVPPDVFQLKSITALVGGTAIPVTAHDTSAPALPSQVSVVLRPTDPTGVNQYRQTLRASNYGVLAADVAGFGMETTGKYPGGSRSGPSNLIRETDPSTGLESIILREGQGIALFQSGYSFPHTNYASGIITNLASGHTYCFDTERALPTRASQPLFAIFNGTGSGVVLKVQVMNCQASGDESTTDMRLIKTDASGLIRQGTAVTPVMHDTRASLPPTIKAYREFFYAGLFGYTNGMHYTWPQSERTNSGYTAAELIDLAMLEQAMGLVRQRSMFLPTIIPDVGPILLDPSNGRMFKSKMTGVVIRPGEAIALVSGRQGIADQGRGDYYSVRFEMTYYDNMTYTRAEQIYVS